MTIVPGKARQSKNLHIEMQLAGFASSESVTIWQTLPDKTVSPRGTYTVDNAGVTQIKIKMGSDYPIGTHLFSARGNFSGTLIEGVPFELLPVHIVPTSGVNVEVIAGGGGKQGGYFTFSGRGYQGKESISVWVTRPDSVVVDLGMVRSDGGTWGMNFEITPSDPVGKYHVTGYGNNSGRLGISSFFVTSGDFTQVAGRAELTATPSRTRQLEVVTIKGSGFIPGETVSMWLTQPNGVVSYIGEQVALYGDIEISGYLPAVIEDQGLPVGIHVFSAYGQSSKLLGTAEVELLPGSGMGGN